MMQAYKEGKDLHKFCAGIMHKVAYDLVTKDQRKGTKSINFGIIYGMGKGKLARELLCTVEEAGGLYDLYYDNFQGVKRFIQDVHAMARVKGFVPTLLGRRRPLPNIVHEDRGLVAAQQRQAVNTRIQGSAADICMLAMIEIEKDNILRELGYQMLSQVHD